MNCQRSYYLEYDMHGNARMQQSTEGMISPVRCNHCGQTYDLCEGKPVDRYADCTVYITPCCGRQVDDRPAGWASRPAFERLR